MIRAEQQLKFADSKLKYSSCTWRLRQQWRNQSNSFFCVCFGVHFYQIFSLLNCSTKSSHSIQFQVLKPVEAMLKLLQSWGLGSKSESLAATFAGKKYLLLPIIHSEVLLIYCTCELIVVNGILTLSKSLSIMIDESKYYSPAKIFCR